MMQSPPLSRRPSSTTGKGTKSGEVMCPRHPRSWVEKKVFFITKTRLCPYCELESYVIPRFNEKGEELEVPCEPGFGGTALPERKPSRVPRHRRVEAPTPRTRASATPRGSSAGDKGGFAPGAGVRGRSFTHGGGRGRGGPAGVGTPSQRGYAHQGQAPRTATVRRTAVFQPTQPVDQGGRLPRGAGQRKYASSSSLPGSRGTHPPKHRRTTSTPALRRSDSGGDARPVSMRSSGGGAGDGAGVSGEEDESSRPKVEAFAAPLSAPSALAGGPKKAARGLMFTSAARKKSWSDNGVVVEPPSPSGSALSSMSAVSNSTADGSDHGLGNGRDHGRRSSYGEVGLVLPPSIAEHSPPAYPGASSVVTVVTSKSESRAAPSADADVAVAEGASDAMETVGPSPTDVLETAELLEPASAREQVRPAAAVVANLAAALAALGPKKVGGLGGAGRVMEAAGAALSAVRDACTLTNVIDEGGGVVDRDEGEEMGEGVAEEEAEAAGALLTEAGYAVETFAKTARALVWSGNDPSKLGEMAAYVERHHAAVVAVFEAARRAKLLIDTLVTGGDKDAKETAAAQRQWLSVLDRHEAWRRRRDSRKALLMAEPEISAGSVTVFKDSRLLPEGTFGTTYAAEYLGVPVAATVLPFRTSDPVAALWSTASAKLLRRSATSELRALAARVPPHPRLARTHGNETISPQVPLRVVTTGEQKEGNEEPAALVLVGEMVEGGSLRDRMKAYGATFPVDEGTEGSAAVFGAVAGDSAASSAGEVEVGAERLSSEQGEESEEAALAAEAQAAQLLRRRKVLADIAEGLAYLHECGVSHGALTTENVLLDVDGRAKLSLFGLAETRRAVASFRASAASASEEWDALLTRGVTPRIIDPPGSAWTAPETWLASAAKQKEAAKLMAAAAVASDVPIAGEEETAPAADTPVFAAAEALEEKKRSAFAADAYAFGMIAWEVLTGSQPWEGLTVEEVSKRVSRGERPPLSFKAISLEGYDNFGDLIRLLWAQDRTARPALQDVARLLHVPDQCRARSEAAPVVAGAADDSGIGAGGADDEYGAVAAGTQDADGVAEAARVDESVAPVGGVFVALAGAAAGAAGAASATSTVIDGVNQDEDERDVDSSMESGKTVGIPEAVEAFNVNGGAYEAPTVAAFPQGAGDATQQAEENQSEATVGGRAGVGAQDGLAVVAAAGTAVPAEVEERAEREIEKSLLEEALATATAPEAASETRHTVETGAEQEAVPPARSKNDALTKAEAADLAGAATPSRVRLMPPTMTASPGRPLISSSPLASTDSSRSDELLFENARKARVSSVTEDGGYISIPPSAVPPVPYDHVQVLPGVPSFRPAVTAPSSSSGGVIGDGADVSILPPPYERVRVLPPPGAFRPTLAPPLSSSGCGSEGGDYFSVGNGRNRAASREHETSGAAVATATALKNVSEVADRLPAPVASVSNVLTVVVTPDGGENGNLIVGEGGGGGSSSSSSSSRSPTLNPQPSASTSTNKATGGEVSSPDLDQLSVASGAGWKALATPPPPPRPLSVPTQTGGHGGGNRAVVAGDRRTDAAMSEAPKPLVVAEVSRTMAAVVVDTPSKRERATDKLSFFRLFGKKKGKDGSGSFGGTGGVPGFDVTIS